MEPTDQIYHGFLQNENRFSRKKHKMLKGPRDHFLILRIPKRVKTSFCTEKLIFSLINSILNFFQYIKKRFKVNFKLFVTIFDNFFWTKLTIFYFFNFLANSPILFLKFSTHPLKLQDLLVLPLKN